MYQMTKLSNCLFGSNNSEQDKGLESLSEIISRQKFMAQGIHTEIDLQNGEYILWSLESTTQTNAI